MIRKHDIPNARGTDKYTLYEGGTELVQDFTRQSLRFADNGLSWFGGKNAAQCVRDAQLGDEDLAARSDELLRKIEDQIPVTRAWRNVDDVVGALPIIPAYLAGVPQSMRRRQRTTRDTAPVSIFMDLTVSAGISGADMLARGTTLLALVRLLVEHRAVELWVGISLGSKGRRHTTAWRIDTAPLDLARAAHLIAHPSMARGIGYSLGERNEYGHGEWSGQWPFNDHEYHTKTQEASLKEVFVGTDLLYVPPMHLKDPMVTDPVGWLKRTMARYVPQED